MKKTPTTMVDAINHNMTICKKLGIAHVETEKGNPSEATVKVDGKITNHFGSCSYLNLEYDERLKSAAKEAIEEYGVQFSSSRAYVSVALYSELEELLAKMFGGTALVSPSTTLGHMSNLPIIIGKKDAVILDQQVHSSVQMASQLVRAAGTYIEMVRHNNMEALENRIEKLRGKYDKIWYLADGIYSMYGDTCPIADLFVLMEKYPELHLYVDDAHGLSWAGKNGVGHLFDTVGIHPRMVFITSFSKGFGASGGATIFPTQEMAQLVRNCGNTHIFSGPLPPPIIAGAIASAKIHLSKEITVLQEAVHENMLYFLKLAKQFNLPLVNASRTPIMYVGSGKFEMTMKLCKGLLDNGYYTGIAGYPSVPVNNSGVRLTINRLHSKEQIHGLVSTMSNLMDGILKEHNYSKEEIMNSFKDQAKKITV